MDNQNPGAWYEKRAVVIILIIVFFPIGILMLWKSRKFSRNAKVALSTCVGILVIAGAIFDQGAEIKQDNQTAAPSVAKPDATVITAETTPVTVEPKNSLEEEIAELRSEFQQLNAEMRVLERDNPTFYIQGEIQGWDGDTVHIWGQSQPCNSDITTLGTLIESGNIILRNPDITQKNKRVYMSIDCGLHYFKEMVQSKNRLGYPIDVYVFGPQPKEIKETYIKLSDLIKKRKSAGAQWLKKKFFDSKPVTDETEAKTKLLALNAFLEKNKEFKGITIGSSVNAVEKLKPDTLYDRYNDFAFHIFKDDGVIIQSKFEEVVAITWIFDVHALFQYYTYLRENLD